MESRHPLVLTLERVDRELALCCYFRRSGWLGGHWDFAFVAAGIDDRQVKRRFRVQPDDTKVVHPSEPEPADGQSAIYFPSPVPHPLHAIAPATGHHAKHVEVREVTHELVNNQQLGRSQCGHFLVENLAQLCTIRHK